MIEAPERPTWAAFPAARPAAHEPSDPAGPPPPLAGLARTAYVAAVSAIGPAQRLDWVAGPERALALAAVAVLLALADGRAASKLLRVLGIGAASAVVFGLGGYQVTFWFLVGFGLATWAAGDRGLTGLPIPPVAARAPVAVLALIAMLRGRTEFGWNVPLLLLLTGTLAVLVLVRWPDLLHRFAVLVGRAVSRALFALLGVVVVLLPWALHRAVRTDALGTNRLRRAPSAWVQAVRRPARRPDRTWMADPAGAPVDWRRRLIVWAAAAVVVAASVLVWDRRGEGGDELAAPPASSPTPSEPAAPEGSGAPPPSEAPADPEGEAAEQPALPIPPAYADDPWYPDYAADVAYAGVWLDQFRQIGFEKLRDTASRFVNVEDGVRRSWAPPPCECERFEVWVYGSATAFGIGQRDEHTIPSELARSAWANGVALDVRNKGVPADQLWLQVDRFAWDLAHDDPPDAVVFLGGVSDLNAARWLDARLRRDDRWAADTVAEDFLSFEPIADAIADALRGSSEPPPAPPGVRTVDPEPAPDLDPAGVAQLAVDRFARSMASGQQLADHHGVRALFAWEPMRLGRPPVPGEPVLEGDEELRVVVGEAARRLPEGVADLSNSLDGVEGPLYWDDVHTNERGAAAVGARLSELLLPVLLGGAP